MINVKLSAREEKLLRAAQTPSEHAGIVAMLVEKLDVAHLERKLAKEQKAADEGKRFNSRDAINIMKGVLGDDLSVPPFPTAAYMEGIARNIRSWNMDAAFVLALAEKVKATLKPPFQLSWIFNNHERIMAGTVYGQAKPQAWRQSDQNRKWHGGTLDTKLEL